MGFNLFALRSMTFIDTFKVSQFLLENEYMLSGTIEQPDKIDCFFFICFRFSRFLGMPDVMLFLML